MQPIEVSFRITGKTPEIFNPITGAINAYIAVPIEKEEEIFF
jgi:hypothetical protein